MSDKPLSELEEKCTDKLDLSYSNTKKRVNWEKTNGFKLKHGDQELGYLRLRTETT